MNAGASTTFIGGAAAGDQTAWVHNAGDVNGDGLDDLLVSAETRGLGSPLGQLNRSYVVFGTGTNSPIDLAALGPRGFLIDGPPSISGYPVPGGDVNGDGLADIITSNAFADVAGRTHAGRVAVVFGKASTTPVDTDALGTGGYEIYGSQAEAFAGSLSYVRDLNGDGRDEVLVIEPLINRATVLYGKTSNTSVDLASIGAGGYRIDAPEPPGLDYAERVGDINGDGFDDLGLTGACGGGCAGRTWISHGKADNATVDLANLGSGGFAIDGNGLAGVSAVGDVNGDGKPDIGLSDYNAQRSFVVFGRTETSSIAVSSLGSAGFRITGTEQGQLFGIGDVDGDGRDDLATRAAHGVDTPEAAVVFGKADSSTIELTNLLDHGFFVFGVHPMSGAAGTGDFSNGLLIAAGSPLDSPFGRERSGGARLFAPPAPSFDLPEALVYTRDSEIAPVTPSAITRSSAMQYSVSPELPAGLTLNPSTGAISGKPTTITGVATYTVTGSDRLGSHLRNVSIRIDSETITPDAPAANETTGAFPSFSWSRASAQDNTEPVDSYNIAIDGQLAGTLPASSCGADACRFTATAPVPDGAHTWQVQTAARDGHIRTSASRPFTVVAPPVAKLGVSSTAAMTGETVNLDASQSSDPNGGISKIEFDTDGNGTYESDSATNPRRSTSFSTVGDFDLGVRITDSAGLQSEARATVRITLSPPSGELGVSINSGEIATNDPNVTISLVWPRLAETALVSNDGGFGSAGSTRTLAVSPTIPWKLASSGPERLPKIAYVRFRGGQSGRETYTDDIILDQRPPQVAAATLTIPATRGPRAAATRRARLRVAGRDENSGIRQVVVAKTRAGKAIARKSLIARNRIGKRKTTTTLSVPSNLRVVYVRVTDVAGNRSQWLRVTRKRR